MRVRHRLDLEHIQGPSSSQPVTKIRCTGVQLAKGTGRAVGQCGGRGQRRICQVEKVRKDLRSGA